MANPSNSERDQSEFNMAVSYLNRLNFFFLEADISSKDLNAHSWFHSLLVLFRELSTEMGEEEITEIEKTTEIINPLIVKTNKDSQRTGTNEIGPELYLKLHKLEMKLRKILKESGMQTKMKEDFLEPENW